MKIETQFGSFNVYCDPDMEPGTVVIYNYGRIYIHPDDDRTKVMVAEGRLVLRNVAIPKEKP